MSLMMPGLRIMSRLRIVSHLHNLNSRLGGHQQLGIDNRDSGNVTRLDKQNAANPSVRRNRCTLKAHNQSLANNRFLQIRPYTRALDRGA